MTKSSLWLIILGAGFPAGFLLGGRLAADLARSHADPGFAARIALAAPEGRLRSAMLGMVMKELFERDPAKALETADACPGVGVEPFPDFDAVKVNAAQIPAILRLPNGTARDFLLRQALINSFSPVDALAEAERLEGYTREFQVQVMALRLAEEAKARAFTAESFVTRAALREAVGGTLAETDPAAAVRCAEEHLVGPFKMDVLNRAADTLSKTDPAER